MRKTLNQEPCSEGESIWWRIHPTLCGKPLSMRCVDNPSVLWLRLVQFAFLTDAEREMA